MIRELKWYTGKYPFSQKEGSNGKIKKTQTNIENSKMTNIPPMLSVNELNVKDETFQSAAESNRKDFSDDPTKCCLQEKHIRFRHTKWGKK